MAEHTSVVLLGPGGEVAGVADKLDAHRSPGSLHLAFSVFLYRSDGSVLLQQRSAAKYHFPGIWANACCSHPEPGDDLVWSAERRVAEELGITCRLSTAGSFTYRAACLSSGLVEHELDHVLLATVEDDPSPDPGEVAATLWVDPEALLAATDHPPRSWSPPPAAVHPVVPSPLAPWLGPALRLAEAARSRFGH